MCDPLKLCPELGSERRQLRSTGWDSGRGYEDRILS